MRARRQAHRAPGERCTYSGGNDFDDPIALRFFPDGLQVQEGVLKLLGGRVVHLRSKQPKRKPVEARQREKEKQRERDGGRERERGGAQGRRAR
jgi:hypothetical protein